MSDSAGKLYLVATPIGNIEDMTYRAVRILGEVDAIACEDTRETRKLFEKYGIKSPAKIIAYHEHNERAMLPRLVSLLSDGAVCALLTDAGYPSVSDPGYRLVAACAEAEIPVEVLPGASAVLTALVLSGLSTSSFTFKGFPPRKSGERRRFLEPEAELPHTLVFFESPHRIGQFLADAYAVLGDRLAAVCLELTKKFERVHRGYLKELAAKFDGVTERGEITVVIAGANKKFVRVTPHKYG